MKYAGQTIRVVTAEIRRDGRYLILKRPAKAVLAGFWEFPGGRVRDDEDDESCLKRNLFDSLGVEPVIRDRFLAVDHPYEQYTVHLRTYRVDIGEQELVPPEDREYAWVAPDEFENYQFPAADEQTVGLLLQDETA